MLADARRYNVLVCGRRWGKTLLAERLLAETALAGKPAAYLCPTYKMLKAVWRELCELLGTYALRTVETEHRIELPGGGAIDMWSGDDAANAVRGRKYARVILDEAALIPGLSVAWERSLRPTLTDYRGDAWIISTPRRGGTFEELYERGVSGTDANHWQSWKMPSSGNPFLDRDELEEARQGMSAQAYAQEYEADFEASESDLVYALDRIKTVREAVEPWEACKRRVVGIDPGGGDPTAIVPLGVASGVYGGYADHIHQYGEFYRRGDVTLDMVAGYLGRLDKLGKIDLVVVGETNGNILTNELRRLGFNAQKADMRREEGIETVRWLLEAGHMTIAPDCQNSLAEFAGYRWAKGRDMETGDRFATGRAVDNHADAMDARRYGVLGALQRMTKAGAGPVRMQYK